VQRLTERQLRSIRETVSRSDLASNGVRSSLDVSSSSVIGSSSNLHPVHRVRRMVPVPQEEVEVTYDLSVYER